MVQLLHNLKSEKYKAVKIEFDKYTEGVVATLIYPDNYVVKGPVLENKKQALYSAKVFIDRHKDGR